MNSDATSPKSNLQVTRSAPTRPSVRRPPLPLDCVEGDSLPLVPKRDRVYWDDAEKLWFKDCGNSLANDQEFRKQLSSRLYSPSNRPKEPKARFRLAGIPVCTPGNLTAISAAPKSGKSSAVGAMIAATFSKEGQDCLGWTSENPSGLAIVHLDTEQCPFDHWQGIQRAIRRAGVSTAPDWLRSYCVTGFPHAGIRQAVRHSLDMAAQQFGGIHSLILDGAADAIADVNDPAESNEFVAELHTLAIEYDCPIIGVIHLNPGSQKTRGHLGSQLERKAETNLQLEKSEDEITIIWADKNRRASISKKSAPCFAWDESRHMHVSVENPAEAKKEAKAEAKTAESRDEAVRVFAQANKSALRHKDLVSQMEVSLAMSNVGAKKKLQKWLVSQIVTKQESGLYALTQ